MQSFKSYLKEDNLEQGILQFSIFFNEDVKYFSDNQIGLQELLIKLKLHFKIEAHQIQFVSNLNLRIDIPVNNFSNLQEISNKVIEDVKNILHVPNDLLDEYRTKSAKLEIFEMPNNIIEWEYIIINCKNSINLKKVHKLFKCKYLDITNCYKIIGNILGIVLLDKSISLNLYNTGGLSWMKKVYEYRERNGDILECQEELISEGFGELAKL